MSTTVTREEFEALSKRVESIATSNDKDKKPKRTRAATGFNLYVGEQSKKVKEKNPSLIHTDAFKKAVSSWKELKDSEKKKWNDKAKKNETVEKV